MTKWPKEWLDATQIDVSELSMEQLKDETVVAAYRLAKLANVGALKDPPKLREIWWCPVCNGLSDEEHGIVFNSALGEATKKLREKYQDCEGIPIKMREVTDES